MESKCPNCDSPKEEETICCELCQTCGEYQPWEDGWTRSPDGDQCPECSMKEASYCKKKWFLGTEHCECPDCEAARCPRCHSEDPGAIKAENCCHYCIGCEDYERYDGVEGWTDSDDGELCPGCNAESNEDPC